MQSTAAPPRTGRTLGVVAYGTFLALMAYTAPLASLPDIAADLGAGVSASSWIVASTSVGLAVALVPAGALGDDVGRRRVFTAGAVLLAASSALAAPAPDAWLLVAARVLQGVASAAVLACGLALLGAAYPGRARVAATAWWGAAFGAGVALGPVLMALVQAASSWRITYVVLAGLAAALALVGPALLGESTLGRRRGVDPAGALLLAAGLGCLLTALTEGRLGWARPLVLALLAGAAVLLAAFVLHQLRATEPMIDLRGFRRPRLAAATIGAFVTGTGVIAITSYTPTLLQRGYGEGVLFSAVVLLAWSGPAALSALGVRVLPERWSGPARIAVGLVVVGAGIVALSGLGAGSPTGRLVAGLVVAGVGTGAVTATLGREAVASVPADQAGTGSGINNTSRYLGAALGVTVVAALAGGSGAELVSGWNVACWVCAASSVAGAAAVAALGPAAAAA